MKVLFVSDKPTQVVRDTFFGENILYAKGTTRTISKRVFNWKAFRFETKQVQQVCAGIDFALSTDGCVIHFNKWVNKDAIRVN